MVAATVLHNSGFAQNQHSLQPPSAAGLYFPPGFKADPCITATSKSKLFLPLRLTQAHVLDENDHNVDRDWFDIRHGNSVDGDAFYIVSALRLMKRGK